MHALLKTALFAAYLHHVFASPALIRRGESPAYFADPSTTTYCTWWFDNISETDCKAIPGKFGSTFEDFLRWNPLVDANCSNFNTFQSYCVEAFGEPTGAPTASPTTALPTATPSTTQPGNGVVTPKPTQPGMVANCNKFHLQVPGEFCADIASKEGITLKQLTTWNTGVGDDCSSMWADTYFCVGIIGFTPTPTPSTTIKPTSITITTHGNGITTPLPTQPGMVSNCNKFHRQVSGEFCADIASKEGITLKQFTTWNTGVGDNCNSMWADVYFCVGIIGFTPTPTPTPKPTTTKPGNGVATPTPIQEGMAKNCKKFYFVKEGETCAQVLSTTKVTLANFFKWNPAVKSDCSGLWSKTYACIAVM